MTKPVFLPANFFWHKFFGCPLNRPLCDELHFHKITRLEMSRYSFSGWESAGQPFSLLEIDDIPGIERLWNVLKKRGTICTPLPPNFPWLSAAADSDRPKPERCRQKPKR